MVPLHSSSNRSDAEAEFSTDEKVGYLITESDALEDGTGTEQHQCVSSSVLIDINDTIVTSQMLDAIVNHQLLTPGPNMFHQGRAGVRDTLHRITGVWGLRDVSTDASEHDQSQLHQTMLQKY